MTFPILVALTAPVAAAEPAIYFGACDGSAAIALDANHFVVADDDSNILRIYDIRTRAFSPAPFETFLGTPKPPGEEKHLESDIEGAARIGDRIYWIASFGRDSDGHIDDNRKRFFAARITTGGAPDGGPGLESVGSPYEDLRKALRGAPGLEAFAKAYGEETAAQGPPPEDDTGFNIEGLAADESGGLLIAFRNPRPEGKALVVPLRNPAELVEGKSAQPVFGKPILLNLDKRGVRSIERIGARYLIVAGPHGKAKEDDAFALYEWSGLATDDKPRRLQTIPRPDKNASPESLFALPGEKEIVIVFDEGDRKSDGVKCKRLPDGKKSFRAINLPAP